MLTSILLQCIQCHQLTFKIALIDETYISYHFRRKQTDLGKSIIDFFEFSVWIVGKSKIIYLKGYNMSLLDE